MKKLVMFLAGLSLTFAASAQSTGAKSAKQLANTQAVISSVVNHPEMMVITGRITDAETRMPITDAKINFEKFGDELVNAAIDKNGNYALAINKNEIGEQIRVTFKIEGYKCYVAKSIKCNKPFVDLDLNLWPDQSTQASNANIKYTLSDDAQNTLVIKF